MNSSIYVYTHKHNISQQSQNEEYWTYSQQSYKDLYCTYMYVLHIYMGMYRPSKRRGGGGGYTRPLSGISRLSSSQTIASLSVSDKREQIMPHVEIRHVTYVGMRQKRQHTATYCNTLQHTSTYCNMLQLTATSCNTLLMSHMWKCVMSHTWECVTSHMWGCVMSHMWE